MNKRIKIGSQVFFSQYKDYSSHDVDYVEFQDEPIFKKTLVHAMGKVNDIFYYHSMAKDEFIEFELKHCEKTPMAVGKFLVPELVKYMNISIEDLKKFQFAIENIDKRHQYEKIIFDAYIENNDFILSKEQLDKAYKSYKGNKEY